MTLSDQDILRVLMRGRSRIAAAAWVVVHDAHAAEDIFQNVALKAITKDVTFEADAALLSWAFITARREGIDWLRRQQRESIGLDPEILDLLDREWLAETMPRANARMDALRECLDAAPRNSRRLLRLRYAEGHACGDIAETLGVRLDAIYKRLSRLHQALRECVELRLQECRTTEA